MSWAKPSSKTLKPSVTEWYGIIYDDNATLAAFVAQDAQFLAKFGDATTIGNVLTNWRNGNPADGEFASVPVKVVKGTVYLFVIGATDVSGLTAKKLPNGNYQITVNAPNGYSAMLGLLAGEVGRNLTRYYSTVDPSTKPNAAWANSKMNKTFPSAATPLIAEGGLIVPYVTADTSITLMNPSPWQTTYTVSAAPMGQDPRTGSTTVSLLMQPGESHTLVALVTADSGAYVATNGPRPSVFATRTGLDIPVLPEEVANSTAALATIIQTGTETELIVVGDHEPTSTINYTAYGPDGSGPANAGPFYAPPNLVTDGKMYDAYHLGLPPNSSTTMTPQTQTGSKACTLLLYTDPTTSDQRIRAGQSFVDLSQTPEYVAKAYVQFWLPDNQWRFYFYNFETRALINGDSKGTPSFAQGIAEILVDSPGANGQTVAQLLQWLYDQTDCNPSNGELCSAWTPLLWNNIENQTKALVLGENPCNQDSDWQEFTLQPTDMQAMYSLIKDQFLWRYVMNNPELYGGSPGGVPDMTYQPNWNIGGADTFQCP